MRGDSQEHCGRRGCPGHARKGTAWQKGLSLGSGSHWELGRRGIFVYEIWNGVVGGTPTKEPEACLPLQLCRDLSL